MIKFHDSKFRLIVAALLGIFALVSNLLFGSLFSASWLTPGYLLLFMAAQSLGLSGAAVALCSGMVPYSLIEGQYLEAFRAITLCLALAVRAKYRPTMPAYMLVFFSWLIVLGPVFISLRAHSSVFANLPLYHFAVLAWSDTLLALLSSALLLQPTIWTTLTKTPRYYLAQEVLVHWIAIVLNATIVTTLFCANTISGLSWHNLSLSAHTDENWLLAIMLAGLVLPIACSQSALRWFNKLSLLQTPAQANAERSKSFSGIASDHWRKQQHTDQSDHPTNTTTIKEPSIPTATTRSSGVCSINREGIIEFANRMFFKLTGIEDESVIGRDIRSIGLHHELCSNLLSITERTFNHGNQVREIKISLRPQSVRYLEIASQTTKSAGEVESAADSVIICMRDVTERRTIESHLLRAQKLGSLGSLVRSISHDFNNALTTIIGYCGASRELNSQGINDKKLLDQIHAAANAAAAEIRQLLEFAEDSPALMRAENLCETIRQRLGLIKKLVGEAVEIRFIDSLRPLAVKIDPNLLTQALTNLVINSKESLNGRGKIEISLDNENIDEVVSNLHIGAKPGNFARLKVKDWGTGMNRDVLARAFEPLFTTKGQAGHAGLGLSIVYAIVRAHDGFLTAESHPGKGTTISLYIPLSEHVTENASEERPIGELSSIEQLHGDEHILVVEDEANVRDLLRTVLTSLGYKVSLCADGQEAIEIAQNTPFDLIVCDLGLPKMSGNELIEILRENNRELKALMISGYGLIESVKDDYTRSLSKPFEVTALAQELRTLLDGALPNSEHKAG